MAKMTASSDEKRRHKHPFTVLGTAEDGDWFRIARSGKALGYVYAPLIAPR